MTKKTKPAPQQDQIRYYVPEFDAVVEAVDATEAVEKAKRGNK